MKIGFLASALRLAADDIDAPDELKEALKNDPDFVATLSKLVSASSGCSGCGADPCSLTLVLASSVADSRRWLI